MGPKAEFLELARALVAARPDLADHVIDLAYELQAAAERWLAKHPAE